MEYLVLTNGMFPDGITVNLVELATTAAELLGKGTPECGAHAPNLEGDGADFLCSRVPGHEVPHVAHLPVANPDAFWERYAMVAAVWTDQSPVTPEDER